ncbi:hypothetical protein OS493_015975 [Desmophyllum pertusum]|uniref:Uncharacterized protein n=1 Tax=Desmophyllum pertusum TaxID=174260 RepID=A0A9X0CH13_9CNID|nr:hypothetical protein OS493_015975 [Desmophyllum pertusum]
MPIRPPKSPRILKMAKDMCIEKKFWCYIQKGKNMDTCPLGKGKDMDSCPLNEQEAKLQSPSGLNTENNQPALEAKEKDKEVMTFTFDDYECDLDSGICVRRRHKSAGVKYVPRNNAPPGQGPGLTERSESVPSLAESEDFDDLPSG